MTSHDLASEHAEKLRELINLWWQEAERYQVLPLNDAQNRWTVRNPHSLAARRRLRCAVPFTGTIRRVVVELADDQQRDPVAELAAAVATQ